MLRLLLHRISQLFSAHSLTPGATRPTSDLKLTYMNQHLVGQPPVFPPTGANAETLRRMSNPPVGQGRLKALDAKG